jgi:outer membrane protein assembly factor BamB
MRAGPRRAFSPRASRRAVLGGALAVSGAALLLGCSASASNERSRISARIDVPGHPFRIAAGRRYIWVLSRGPQGACTRRPCTVFRIDPETNRVVGKPTPFPGDGWDLAVGAGSVWVTQFDGRLLRIDARTGRIRARIAARPIYFGSTVAFGGGFVWTGNDDRRYKRGSTVAKLDPTDNHVVGKPLVIAGPEGPQSIVFGGGDLWVADHSGWLVKVNPKTMTVAARQRLAFGPHGVAAGDRAVYVADAHADRLLEADPKTAKIRRVSTLSPGAIFPVLGAGSIWSSSAAGWSGPTGSGDDRVLRIDPETLRIAELLHVGGNVPSVGFGFGSAWAPDQRGHVVRIAPSR